MSPRYSAARLQRTSPVAPGRRSDTNQTESFARPAFARTGVLLIVIPGEIAIQTGLPGPLQAFATPPTSAALHAMVDDCIEGPDAKEAEASGGY